MENYIFSEVKIEPPEYCERLDGHDKAQNVPPVCVKKEKPHRPTTLNLKCNEFVGVNQLTKSSYWEAVNSSHGEAELKTEQTAESEPDVKSGFVFVDVNQILLRDSDRATGNGVVAAAEQPSSTPPSTDRCHTRKRPRRSGTQSPSQEDHSPCADRYQAARWESEQIHAIRMAEALANAEAAEARRDHAVAMRVIAEERRDVAIASLEAARRYRLASTLRIQREETSLASRRENRNRLHQRLHFDRRGGRPSDDVTW